MRPVCPPNELPDVRVCEYLCVRAESVCVFVWCLTCEILSLSLLILKYTLSCSFMLANWLMSTTLIHLNSSHPAAFISSSYVCVCSWHFNEHVVRFGLIWSFSLLIFILANLRSTRDVTSLRNTRLTANKRTHYGSPLLLLLLLLGKLLRGCGSLKMLSLCPNASQAIYDVFWRLT